MFTPKEDKLADALASGEIKLVKKESTNKEVNDRLLFLQEQQAQIDRERQKLLDQINKK